jgi:hypothetical protein
VEQQRIFGLGRRGRERRTRGLGFYAPSGCVFPNCCSYVWGP